MWENSWLIKKGRKSIAFYGDAGDGFAMSEAAVRCYLADRGFSYQPRLCFGEDGANARRLIVNICLSMVPGRFPLMMVIM